MRNKLFALPDCPHCAASRAFLAAKGVDYVEYDVSRDTRALALLVALTGHREVPALVAGAKAVIGFNAESWDELLEYSAALQLDDPHRLPSLLGADPYDADD
jgi:glutaredoxin